MMYRRKDFGLQVRSTKYSVQYSVQNMQVPRYVWCVRSVYGALWYRISALASAIKGNVLLQNHWLVGTPHNKQLAPMVRC